ncbi:type II secretion system F family protein [bacterium]|nr:type II secretion system F family protein [bacterium]
MALFFYQAFSKDGKKVSGFVDAPSRQIVKEKLARKGIFPVKIAQTSQDAKVGFFKRIFQRGVSDKDKILLTKQLSVLLKSGVPLLQSLELLTEHFEGRLRSIVISLKDDIKEGGSLTDGLKKFPKVFDVIYVQLIRAGEASGNLELILDRLTEYLQRRADVQKRIKSALMLPIIQLVVAVAVVGVLITFVVPQMADVLQGLGKDLPGTTQFMLDFSSFITNNYFKLSFLIIAIVGFLKYWFATSTGARFYDTLKLRLPIVGYFSRMGAVVQFSRTLGMLMESGVNLSEALDIVVSVIDNKILSDTLSDARDNIVKQGKIAQYLKQTNIFPPIAIYLIKTGEESGQLGSMLLTVSKNYEEDLTEKADGLTSLLGPIMLLIMAIVVGFIIMSVVVPMIEGTDIA